MCEGQRMMSKSEKFTTLIVNMINEWKWIIRYAKKYRLMCFIYILFGFISTAMSLCVSVASKYLIDSVVSHTKEQLITSAAIVIALTVFQFFFTSVSSWITAKVNSKVDNEIREDIYSHIVTADWQEIGKYHSGDLINRLERDVSTVSSGVIGFIPSAITRFVQFFGSLAIVLYYDKTMAVLALLSAPFLFLSSRMLVKTIRKYSKETRKINGDVLSYSEESVQNIQIIKAFDLTKDYINNFSKLLNTYRQTRLEYEKFNILMTLCFSVIGMVVSYFCYGWGVYRLWQGAITYGTMTLFLQISGTLSSSFNSLASLAPSAISVATSAGRIMEITSFKTEKDAQREKALEIVDKSKNTGVRIEFKNVSFKYDDGETPVLKNINLKILPGETIALIGASGEGKTTIFKLILGLLEPTEGEIVFTASQGESINASDSTRRFCSYVPQDIGVFSGTIEDNLRIVKNDATDEELQNVLHQAELSSLINSLPQGMQTELNEHGANFSQGQLQRLAIARSLLRKSLVLLMDEATSALDSQTESQVLENIMVSEPNQVRIITTHRESMLKYCKAVYKIMEDGTLEKQ